jgi:serine/threonine protein kinase
VILYGYNVQLHQSSQFLVYEYLANGSLNTFLMSEDGRTRLPSQIRLSIMFQITRSVHFLHTGGCNGLEIFHRDIKAGNICLAKDYTAKLIDCGLAKFVPDNKFGTLPGSITPTILNESGAVAFGTPGYVCPIYSRGHVPFSAPCDVFSLGVVFVELIVGCLQGGQSSRNDQNFGDFFSRYIRDNDDEPIENGWEILMSEADVAAEWNVDTLKTLCKVALRCMAASPKKRITTADLIEELSRASLIDFNRNDSDSEGDWHDSVNSQELRLNSFRDSDSSNVVNCVLCNRSTARNVTCRDGHHTCVQCVEQEIQMQVGRSGDGISCKCGNVFHDKALYGKIASSTFQWYIRERGNQKSLDENFKEIKNDLTTIVAMSESNHNEVMTKLKSIDSKIQRVLGGLAYIATNSVRECPSLIWLVPSERAAGNTAKAWKQRARNVVKTKYDLYFVCQHSFEVVDKKLSITVSRSWLVQTAPVLYLSIFLLRAALTISGLPPLPFPIPRLSRLDQISTNEDFIDDLLDDGNMKSIEAFKAAYTQGSNLPYSDCSNLLTLASTSYEGIVTKATSMKKCHWKETMEPVAGHHGSIIWVKKEYRGLYIDA